MSTRSTTHFRDTMDGPSEAIIYRHSDGYPTGQGADLLKFFADVKAQAQDTRFNDPSYLASKLVVWLARQFATDYKTNHADTRPMDFLSVGIVAEDPGDIQYRYVVTCSISDGNGFPLVAVEDGGGNALGELRDLLRAEKVPS